MKPGGMDIVKVTIQPLYAIAVDLLVFSAPLSVYRLVAPSFSPVIYEMYVTPALFWTDLFSALVIVLGIGNIWVGDKRYFKPGIIWRSLIPLTAIVLLSGLSVLSARLPPLAGYYALRLLFNYLLLWVLRSNEYDLKRVAAVFTSSMVCQALIGLAQFIQRAPLGIPGEMALELNQFGAARVAAFGGRWLRAYGLTFHPNVFGGFMVVGAILSYPFLKRRLPRFLWFVILAGAVLSFSRSAWMAAGLVLPFLFGWLFYQDRTYRRPLGTIAAGLGVFGILFVVLFSGQIKARLQPLENLAELASMYERGLLIEVALGVIAREPLRGIGIGNFPLEVYNGAFNSRPHFVHNVPLLLASECGLLSGLLWYVLWLGPLMQLRRYWQDGRIWPVVYTAGWFALGLIGLWDSYPWNLESGRVLAMILLAGVYSSATLPEQNADKD